MSIQRGHHWVYLCLLLLLVSGCGDGKVRRYPVTGSVKIDGRPADNAVVVFCPLDGAPEVRNLRPSGLTDAQGSYKLMSIQPADGAPAGEYKVIIKWPAPAMAGAEDREGRGPKLGPDRLKGKYYDLDKTSLKATVEKRSNEIPPFELSSK